jgi:endonuclease VIII
MPEGPSIIIVKENLQAFTGSKVISSSGNSDLDFDRINGQKIIGFKTWGKHFLIVFKTFGIRIHFLMFGTYRVDERKKLKPRLSLQLDKGNELNFYTCSVKWIEGPVEKAYDWTQDVMSEKWNSRVTKKRIQESPDRMICDVLMDQNIFSGVGNIIKNETLFRARIHPESYVKEIPTSLVSQVIKTARTFSFEFLESKKEDELKKHLQVYGKKMCPRCNLRIIKKPTGKIGRTSHFCANCQVLYPL